MEKGSRTLFFIWEPKQSRQCSYYTKLENAKRKHFPFLVIAQPGRVAERTFLSVGNVFKLAAV
jgi:hypothetical protein